MEISKQAAKKVWWKMLLCAGGGVALATVIIVPTMISTRKTPKPPVVPPPTKSINASVSGQCKYGDTTKNKATISVNALNGADLNLWNLDLSSIGLKATNWTGIATKTCEITWLNAIPNSYSIDITNGIESTTCNITVQSKINNVITQETIEESTDYKIAANTPIYISRIETMNFDHDLINLKALSEANGDITNFSIAGHINFGFLIDPDMNCTLNGIGSTVVDINGSGNVCGMVVGRETYFDGKAHGKIILDQGLTFELSCPNGNAYGAYFYGAASDSVIAINSVVQISDTNSGYGVWFNNTEANSRQYISGIFSIMVEAYYNVVYIAGTAGGSIEIGGTFTLSETLTAVEKCIFFGNTPSGSSQVIKGIFDLHIRHNSHFVWVENDAIGAMTLACKTTIYQTNGTTLSSVSFNANATGSLTMTGSQFFANQLDSSNMFTKATVTGTYKWNGNDITNSTDFDDKTNKNVADGQLKTKTINDDDASPNFSINVIDEGIDANKKIFNDEYKKVLNDYVRNTNFYSIAKTWFQEIIKKI